VAEAYRVLVTGSREWTNNHLVYEELGKIASEVGWDNMVIIHGACPRGADRFADLWAGAHDTGVIRCPADWRKHGRPAGFRRNAEMVALGANVCLAFYKQGAGNKGTDHCARLAEAAGIPVRRITDADCDISATKGSECGS
jgi:hypothetical protein